MTRASERNFCRGTKIDAAPPKLGNVRKNSLYLNLVPDFAQNEVKRKKKRSSLKFGPRFCPKSGEREKSLHSILVPHSGFVQNLTRQSELFRAPPCPGPGTMYPLNPPLVGPGYDVPVTVINCNLNQRNPKNICLPHSRKLQVRFSW